MVLLAGLSVFAGGCREQKIVAYRIPKEAVATQEMPNPATAQSTNDLPEGHPPIGSAQTASSPNGMEALPGEPSLNVAAGNALQWTAPAHWREKPPGSVRKGSYDIPGNDGAVADLAITAFPGQTGGLFANVNRWRGQIGLPPIRPEQLDETVEHLETAAFRIDVVDMLGTANGQPTRVLGAIVPHGNETWFFKLTGPDALVTAEREHFRAFLQSIKTR